MISHHLITSSKTGVSRLHLAEYHFVELRKFNKNLDELQSGTDKLLYFIKNADEFEKIPVQLQNDENIMEAFHVLESSRWSDLELQDYIRKQEEIERESRQEQGFKEEGRQVGLQEGRQEGAQAKAEFIAMNALRNGLTISVIATITGLSVQEIESLQKNIK